MIKKTKANNNTYGLHFENAFIFISYKAMLDIV